VLKLRNNNLHIRILKIIKAPLLVGVFIFMFSCENDIQEIRELTAKQDSAIYSAQNVEIKYSSNGKLSGLMKTPVLNRYFEGNNKTYLEFPKGMLMFFYNADEVVTSTLKANYAIYYEDEGRYIAKYNVEVVNVRGDINYVAE
jgi:lipopolysaccharide export system protein LptC